MKRLVGVTVIAVLSLIGSTLTLLMGILLAVVMVLVPIPTKDMPGSPLFFKVIFLLSSLFYALPAIWGIFTSVGLFRLRNWARISMIVFSVLLILMWGFGGLIALLMPVPPNVNHSTDTELMAVRYFMGSFSLALVGIGAWWTVFFTRRSVKEQFVPLPSIPVTGQALQEQYPAATLALSDDQQRPAQRPQSISVLAWLMFIGCFFILLSLFLHSPAVLFTKLLTGWRSMLCFACFLPVNFFIGIGLLRLKPAARIAAIGYFTFSFLNIGVFYLAPGAQDLWLANCYFSQDSSGFPVLLRFCDARSGRSFHPLHRYPGPLARTWWRPFHSCGVAPPQAPTPDRESPQAPIAESMRVGPHPRRFDGALGASYSFAPVRNRTEALNTARPPQSLEPAKVPHAVLTESPSEAWPERTEYRTHRCGRRNEAA